MIMSAHPSDHLHMEVLLLHLCGEVCSCRPTSPLFDSLSLMDEVLTTTEPVMVSPSCVPGVHVDCVNHLDQTALFCASLWGQLKATDLLLDYGADPNQ